MTTATLAAEQRVTLTGISWETYLRLLSEHTGHANPRFTYDRGVLEIMVLSVQHEEMNRLIHDLLTVVAEERGIDFFNAGSTTFKREELERGFEPDTCFYIRGAAVVRGKGEIDLAIDPPPDIVIEVEISRSTIDKLDILRAVGVPEVWRYRPGTLTLFRLTEAGYRPSPESALFPGVTGDALSRLLEDGRRLNRSSWLRAVRAWARQLA